MAPSVYRRPPDPSQHEAAFPLPFGLKRILSHIRPFVRSAVRSNGISAFVDQGIISGFNFLTFLLLARWMPSVEFGTYVLAFSVLMFLQTMQHALLTRAHNVLGARKRGSDYATFSRTVLLLVVTGAGAISMLAIGIWAIFDLAGAAAWAAAAAGIALAVGPWLIQDAIRRLLYTAERIPAAAINDAVSYVLQAGAVAWLFFSGFEATLPMVFGVLGASSAVAAIVGWIQVRPALRQAHRGRGRFLVHTRAIWSYGKWLSSGELVGWIGQNGNTWLIGGLLGAPVVAGYRAATYVTNLLNPFDLAVSNYLPVRASRILHDGGPGALRSWLLRKALLLGIPYAMLAVGISAASFWMLDLFYDARYVSGLLALVLTLSVWARFLSFLVGFARVALMAAERNVPIFFAQTLGLILFALFSTTAISAAGMAGAPIARIALQLVIGLYLVQHVRKLTSPHDPSGHPSRGLRTFLRPKSLREVRKARNRSIPEVSTASATSEGRA